MRFNYKKISAIAISTLMTGMTLGVAAAAAYPTPFVSGGVASGTAIVYGTGQGVSALDQQYAGNIQTDLQKYLTSTGGITVIEGGDSVVFEKSSTKFQLGKYLLDVRSTSIDDTDMDTLLADGTFTDDDNDEFDYKQEIIMANLTLNMFDDDDYQQDTPTVGIRITDTSQVLNYTLDFTEEPLFLDLETATLSLMGKGYYILDVASTNDTITLLDSAEEATISEGETITVGGRQVTLEYVGTTEAKFNVDGSTTNSLEEAETQKLSDGSYLGVKDIMYSSKDTGVSKVEFSIGKGKLVIEDGEEVQLNEEDVDNLYGFVATGAAGKLGSITLNWKADDDLFVTETNSPIMPGFETLKLGFGGMTYPTEQVIVAKADGTDNFILENFPIKNTVKTLPLLYSDGTNFTYIGKDDNNRLATKKQGVNMTFTIGTDDYFVLSYKSGEDGESYIITAKGLDDSVGSYATNTVDFEYLVDGSWKSLEADVLRGETVSIGSAEFKVGTVYNESEKNITLWVTGTNYLDRIYSDEGLEVLLPWMNITNVGSVGNETNYTDDCLAAGGKGASIVLASGQLGYNYTVTYNTTTSYPTGVTTFCDSYPATYKLVFNEEDKDGMIGAQDDAGWINVTIGIDQDDEVYISAVSNGDINGYGTAISAAEVGDTDVYLDYVQSALATKIEDDKSGDHEKVTLTYHGGESYGKVFLSDISSVVSSTGGTTAGGAVLVTDAEIANVNSKNLIIVGGSCINSAAAKVLGFSGATCGAAFTASTGVGTGQFLIKSVTGAYTSGKIALVVAGYDAADTVNGVQYLINKKPDTSKSYKGTSATIAEEVITAA
ncbi:MAG: hypothetical protein ABIB47_00210, partial [Candidatus Woesearchaeota archaeon]